ncbi:hypothetical protein QBC33DRAFT_556825 [Phialemonium atrogriseum]|uniref:Uncharacterized protein n=1 Tax=Phialemonium atrogriseum TaxID=1093897 RepID=A0AAJ0C4U9_9PEZI|nr:uncharacterized protein QBC33DRAFT_556825 [Phialemonium atrogriseum]KAK1769532.1 hypothetical protein QBC33DRAFT_556825 [Phialemonium atrogriseum]
MAAKGRTLAATAATLSQNADPEWWKRSISRQQAQVLREAAGFVLRDAIRFYESGKAAQEGIPCLQRDIGTAREAIDALQQDGMRNKEQLKNILCDFDRRYDLQQAFHVSVLRDVASARGQFDRLSEKHASLERDLAALPDLQYEIGRLRSQVESLNAELGLLKEDYSMLSEKSDAKERAECAGKGLDEVELRRTVAVRGPELSPQPADCITVQSRRLDPERHLDLVNFEDHMVHSVPQNATTAGHSEGSVPVDQDKQVTALLKEAEREYLQKSPKSDTSFIWSFLDRVEDDNLCKHIQTSLTTLVDEKLVKEARPRRGKDKRRVVNISPKLTWHQFTHAMRKIRMTPEA